MPPRRVQAMSANCRIMRAFALMLTLSAINALAQGQNNLPDLSTATQATVLPSDGTTSAESSAASSTQSPSSSDAATTSPATTAESTTSPASTTAQSTSSVESSVSTSQSSPTSEAPTLTSGSASITAPIVSLSNFPTIAGAGIPVIGVPDLSNAPFMRKSDMPEGTVFIAVGAVLAFLGSCVLLWRGMVAWSINRSVQRTAMRGTEKTPTWGASKGGSSYKEFEASSMSLDALNSAGKNVRPSYNEDHHPTRRSAVPPAGLFFSPTAQASNRASSVNLTNIDNRGSAFLPAGYYAAPSASDPAGGRNSIAVGGSLAPYARSNLANPSPPTSPGLHNPRTAGHPHPLSRPSREGLRGVSRDGYSSQRSSHVYANNHPSASSLHVAIGAARPGSSSEHLAGTRAPSAVLDEMFENHGHGSRF